ncbi:MAG TPA: thioredoxin fold domain-containing protein [Alphaproteobacteria bacterium]|nr:thioredoxin fold domain-containing protein [Alphaproteobacteria bacterium]
MKKLCLFVLAALLLASPAFAADAKKEVPAVPPPAAAVPAPAADEAKIPDTSNMLFIQNLRKAGTTLYYLGEALGLHGWFAVKDRQVQIFYTTPDSRAILVGALLSPEGANISQPQLALFATTHPEALAPLKTAGAAAPPPEAANLAPSESFYTDLAAAEHVTFGRESAPLVLMIMDVNCPYCHKAWKKLEKAVDDGKLRVQMVPIAALGAKSAEQGARWLAQRSPQDAWKKLIAGDDKVLTLGDPDPAKQASIVRNTEIATRWKVDHTPYFLYRGKNGKIRLIVGEPENAEVILNDIGG